jgi:TRAP-type C4-dicarboxylate transport system permease small subunit
MVEAISRTVNRLAEWAMAVLIAAMVLITGLAIAGRFIFSYSLFWSDELTRFLLIWISFLGMSVGVRRGAHPGIDSLVIRLSPRAARIVLICAAGLSLLFFALMVVYGGVLALRTWPQRSPSMGLRMTMPYLAVPVAGLLMLIHGIALGLKGGLPRATGGQDG